MSPQTMAMSISVLVLLVLAIVAIGLLVLVIRSQSPLFLGVVVAAGVICFGVLGFGLLWITPVRGPAMVPVMQQTIIEEFETVDESDIALPDSADGEQISAPRLPEISDPEGQAIAEVLVSTAEAAGLTTKGAISITLPLSGGAREVEVEMLGDPALLQPWVEAVEAHENPALEVVHSQATDAPAQSDQKASLRLRARLAESAQPAASKTPSNPDERE